MNKEEENISEMEDRPIKVNWNETEREKKVTEENVNDLRDNIKSPTYV